MILTYEFDKNKYETETFEYEVEREDLIHFIKTEKDSYELQGLFDEYTEDDFEYDIDAIISDVEDFCKDVAKEHFKYDAYELYQETKLKEKNIEGYYGVNRYND